MTKVTLNPQVTGNVGLYYCCYKLSLLGWNVMPTARNARGVDIIAYSADASRFVGIQVKALSKRNPVPLGPSLDKCMGDFWIIVNKVASDAPSAFVLTPSQVKERAVREKSGPVHTSCSHPATTSCSSRKHGSVSAMAVSNRTDTGSEPHGILSPPPASDCRMNLRLSSMIFTLTCH